MYLTMTLSGGPIVRRNSSMERNCGGTATSRNPLLEFRLSGLFLFRLAQRTFLGLLFQEPPRSTRRPRPLPQTQLLFRIQPPRSFPTSVTSRDAYSY
jgi:hypothetical protein